MKKTIIIFLLLTTSLFAKIYDKELKGFKYVRMVDGDTFVITIKSGYRVFGENIRVRIRGINTPERNEPLFEESTEVLRELLESGKKIKIKNLDRYKYFGIYADVYVGNINVAEYMLEHGYAKEYK